MESAFNISLFVFVSLSSLSLLSINHLHLSLSFLSLPPQHLFVHIGQTSYTYSDPLLEAVDLRQIYDKFPEKKGGLKELFGKGPHNSFFLIKFWVSFSACVCAW